MMPRRRSRKFARRGSDHQPSTLDHRPHHHAHPRRPQPRSRRCLHVSCPGERQDPHGRLPVHAPTSGHSDAERPGLSRRIGTDRRQPARLRLRHRQVRAVCLRGEHGRQLRSDDRGPSAGKPERFSRQDDRHPRQADNSLSGLEARAGRRLHARVLSVRRDSRRDEGRQGRCGSHHSRGAAHVSERRAASDRGPWEMVDAGHGIAPATGRQRDPTRPRPQGDGRGDSPAQAEHSVRARTPSRGARLCLTVRS